MTSTLATAFPSSILSFNPTITNAPSSHFPPNLALCPRHRRLTVRAHSSNSPVIHNLKTPVKVVVFATAALTFPATPACVEPPTTFPEVLDETDRIGAGAKTTSPLSELLETNEEAVEALESLLQQKLELSEDKEALKILKRLVPAQPEVTDWKFLSVRITSEMGDTESAHDFYEEILKANPLSFEALFENALLMDRCGEGEAVIERLEEAIRVALEDKKEKEARDVRLIMAQILFLQKNVDEALGMYQQLTKEDPIDFRPYFCMGMIYSLLDKNDEAREHFGNW